MRMTVPVVLALACLAATAGAQSADELVAKNTEAKGGLEKIKAVQTLRTRGRLNQGSFMAQVGQEQKRPDKLRSTLTLKNGDIVYYYLDPDSFLEIRTERQQFIRGAVRERQTDLGSYKPVAGVMFPFSMDPRAKYTVEDRRTQFELVNRLSQMLNHMSWAVDAIIAVRDQANQRAAKLPKGDAQAGQLTSLAQAADAIRSKIVATKEGGMITGEERLREYLGGLYGDVNGYDGRPTASQVARADALNRELEDVVREFNQLAGQRIPPINRSLSGKSLEPILVISEQEWQKQSEPQ